MDLISQYALGDDIAILLIVLLIAGLAAVIAGLVVPARTARGGDEAVDATLGGRLGALLGSAGALSLWVGVPVLGLLLLVPGATDDRLVRSGMMLGGLLLGLFSAWRGLMILLPALEERADGAGRARSRLGSLAVLSALGTAVVPVAVTVWLLQGAAGMALLAFAAGTAVAAVSMRLVAVPMQAAGAGARLLVDLDENELDPADEEALGVPVQRVARIIRDSAQSVEITAVTALLASAGILVGLPVLAAEAILVVLLGLAAALLAASLTLVLTRLGGAEREVASLRVGGLLASVLTGAVLAAAAVLWLPSRYAALRFAQAGMADFTDPAIAGPKPLPRTQMTEQIEKAGADMGQWLKATDDSRDAGAFLDVITLYTVNPSAAVGTALVLGALIALAILALTSVLAQRQGGSARRSARMGRTGGAMGALAAAGSAALFVAGALATVILAGTILSVVSAGVPALALTLLAHAGLGALVVGCGQAAVTMAPSLTDRRQTAGPWRDRVAVAALAPRGTVLISAALGGLALLGPVASSLQSAGRGSSVWEERALHALTPMALPLLGGVLLGAVAVLLLAATNLDAARRAGAAAVVDARAAHSERTEAVGIGETLAAIRRSALTPLLVAVAMPVVAGFGLGPAALPGLMLGIVVMTTGLGLWASWSTAVAEAAVEAIEDGRYGGPGSWGHSGALGVAALGQVLRAVLGGLATGHLLLTVLLSALIAPAAVQLVTVGTVDPTLRWGLALVAVLVAGASWAITATSPEVDLEDGQEELSRPLVSRPQQEGRETSLDAMAWDEADGEDGRGSVNGRRR